MKRTYYKEAMIGDKVYKGDRATISTDGIKTTVTEYVDFVGGRSAKTAQYNFPLTTMTFEDACRKCISGGYKEIKG